MVVQVVLELWHQEIRKRGRELQGGDHAEYKDPPDRSLLVICLLLP